MRAHVALFRRHDDRGDRGRRTGQGPDQGTAHAKFAAQVDAPRPLVACNLRIRTERTRTGHLSRRDLRRLDPLRQLPLFDPRIERAHHVERVRPLPTAAVAHPRHHVQAQPGGPARGSFGRTERARVEVDARLRRDAGIAPPVIHEELAATFGERREVRIDGRQRVLTGAFGGGEVPFEIERPPVPRRILEHDVLELFEGVPVRVGTAEHARPPELGARLEPGKDQLAGLPMLHRAHDDPGGCHLRGGQTPGPSAPRHATTAGSKRQRVGLSMRPSSTPSSASQASSTA